jgi:hypothetical protein
MCETKKGRVYMKGKFLYLFGATAILGLTITGLAVGKDVAWTPISNTYSKMIGGVVTPELDEAARENAAQQTREQRSDVESKVAEHGSSALLPSNLKKSTPTVVEYDFGNGPEKLYIESYTKEGKPVLVGDNLMGTGPFKSSLELSFAVFEKFADLYRIDKTTLQIEPLIARQSGKYDKKETWAKASELTRSTEGEPYIVVWGGAAELSPSGRYVSFISNRRAIMELNNQDIMDVWVKDLRTGEEKLIFQGVNSNDTSIPLGWANESQLLITSYNNNSMDGFHNQTVHLANLNGQVKILLKGVEPSHATHDYLIYALSQEKGSVIHALNIINGQEHKIQIPDGYDTTWNHVLVSPDTNYLVYPVHPSSSPKQQLNMIHLPTGEHFPLSVPGEFYSPVGWEGNATLYVNIEGQTGKESTTSTWKIELAKVGK